MTPTPCIYLQSDDMAPYLNATASDIAAGTVVVLSTGRIGVVGRKIPAGLLGALYIEGIFRIAKDGNAIALGADLWWDATNGYATATKSSTANIWLGTALTAQIAADATVDFVLGEDRVPQVSAAITDNTGGATVTTFAAISDQATKDAIHTILVALRASGIVAA